MERFSGTIFGLKKIGKYLTDGDLRKAYAEFKESEETALKLIVNTMLAEGWIVTLSQPRSFQEIANQHGYTNTRLLKQVLSVLTKNDVIKKENEKYHISAVRAVSISPDDVGTVVTNFYYDTARFLPDALKGNTVPLDNVPRIVLESVFSSSFTEQGRGVLLRSFGTKDASKIGIAAFSDVGLPFALQQIEEIFKPEQIRVFLQDYRWISSLRNTLRLLSGDALLEKISFDLLGREVDQKLDLFYGEELFAYSHSSLDERVALVASYLKDGGRLITNDPTLPPNEEISSPAYVLMQTIEGYPQPIRRDIIETAFGKQGFVIQTIGDNWIIAVKGRS